MNKKIYPLRGKAYEPYLKEKQKIGEWLGEKLGRMEGDKNIKISSILDPEDEDYREYKKNGKDYAYGYYDMLSEFVEVVETIPFAIDLKIALSEVLRGMEMLFPSKETCQDCNGDINRALLETLLILKVPGDCTNFENVFFYTTDEGPFNRCITAFLGVFYSAGLYLNVLDILIDEASPKTQASFMGAVRALNDFNDFINQTNKQEKFKLPTEYLEYARTIKASKYGQYGTWTEYCFANCNSPLLRRFIKGEDAKLVIPEHCTSLSLIKGEIKTLMGNAMRNSEMTVDERNGYLFFLSSLHNWICTNEETFDLRGEHITSLIIYFTGGLLDLATDYNYSRGRDKDGSITLLNLVSLLTTAYSNDLLTKSQIMELLDSKHPQCNILRPQTANTIKLLFKSNALFTKHLEGITDEKFLELIKDPTERCKGFTDALIDLGTDFLGVQGVLTDTTDKRLMGMIDSFISNIGENSVIA